MPRGPDPENIIIGISSVLKKKKGNDIIKYVISVRSSFIIFERDYFKMKRKLESINA